MLRLVRAFLQKHAVSALILAADAVLSQQKGVPPVELVVLLRFVLQVVEVDRGPPTADVVQRVLSALGRVPDLGRVEPLGQGEVPGLFAVDAHLVVLEVDLGVLEHELEGGGLARGEVQLLDEVGLRVLEVLDRVEPDVAWSALPLDFGGERQAHGPRDVVHFDELVGLGLDVVQHPQSEREQRHVRLQVAEVQVRVAHAAAELGVELVGQSVDQLLLRVARLQDDHLQDVLQVALEGALVDQRVVQRVPVQRQLVLEQPLPRLEETRLEPQDDARTHVREDRGLFARFGLGDGAAAAVEDETLVVEVDELVLDVGADVDVLAEDQAEQVRVWSVYRCSGSETRSASAAP